MVVEDAAAMGFAQSPAWMLHSRHPKIAMAASIVETPKLVSARHWLSGSVAKMRASPGKMVGEAGRA